MLRGIDQSPIQFYSFYILNIEWQIVPGGVPVTFNGAFDFARKEKSCFGVLCLKWNGKGGPDCLWAHPPGPSAKPLPYLHLRITPTN